MAKDDSKRLGRRQSEESAKSDLNTSVFFIEPMLQLGRGFGDNHLRAVELIWFAEQKPKRWSLSVKAEDWTRFASCPLNADKYPLFGSSQARRFVAVLDRIAPGSKFEYKIALDGKVVFRASAVTPPAKEGILRAIVFGDFTDGEAGACRVASSVYRKNPHIVVIAGDITYDRGRMSEYLDDFFPLYNADKDNPDRGAPLGRSVVTVAAAGNHDVSPPRDKDEGNGAKLDDYFAYFRLWRQPRNGPRLSKNRLREMMGNDPVGRRLLDEFGSKFISRTNFSFDVGNSHWLVLDGNTYVDWTDKDLNAWIERDLRQAANAVFRFVVVHQPGFSSDVKYKFDQRMRVLSPCFERHGVDAVFSGHGHFFERSYPLSFTPSRVGKLEGTIVAGDTVLDTAFDGKKTTRANGVIYIVTGAGGQLVGESARPSRHGISKTTAKLEDERRSFTLLEMEGKRLTLSQLTTDGELLDSIVISK